MKRVAPSVRSSQAITLLTAASLALCLPGHVLAASQTPPAGDPNSTAGTSTTATNPPMTGDPAASAGAGELSSQAIERFKAKDYDAAARLFEQAYGIDPNPNYLFNIGRVYEEKGDIRSAVTYYQRFVKEPGVEIGARELAVQRLRVLKAILNETEAPPPSTTTTAPTDSTNTGTAPPTRTGADNPDPKQSMRLGGYALIGVGGVSLIVGGIFGGLTLAKKGDLDDTMIVEERQSLAHQGKTFAVISDVTLFTGAALLATGVVLAVLARKPRAGSKTAGRSALLPSVGRNHAGLTYSLRF